MNVKSKFDTSDEGKESKKRYMYLGFSNASQFGGANSRFRGPASFGNPHFFDLIFEKLGIKKKSRRRSEGE